MATAKQLDELTECPICTDVYTDPRVLSCGHTCCLKCIRKYIEEKESNEEEPVCPWCRTKLTLPSNRVEDLTKNFFVTNFVQMKLKELSRSVETKETPCEACGGGDDGNESEVQNVASVYCMECQMKLCHNCERGHTAIRATRSHILITLGEQITSESVRPSYCNQHTDESIKIYCFQCQYAICNRCYAELHNQHLCSDLNKVEGGFRKQMDGDVEQITSGVEKCKEMLQILEKKKNEFIEKETETKRVISEKVEQLKGMIDIHEVQLMNELSQMKQKRMKEIERLRKKVQRRVVLMESYNKDVDEVRQKETACDVANAAPGLHDRAEELLKFDVIERSLADLGHVDVTFTSSNEVVDDVSKTLGQVRSDIVKRLVRSRNPTLAHVIPSQDKHFVTAVASLGDEVFVVRYASQRVEVYDEVTFALQRNIAVPGLGANSFGLAAISYGLAACPSNRCLYASDHVNASVHRVELSGSNAVKKWKVAGPGQPADLSVNKVHNLVVACCNANTLHEYTTHGSLVRQIRLKAAGSSPWHAVQLSNGDYAVSHCKLPGVVDVVGVNGQVVSSYIQTSDGRQMKYPRDLAVTKNDDILVADSNNNRILLIQRSTGCVQDLDLPVEGKIQGPRGLYLDESRGRLYVSEWSGQHRVLVFDGVTV